MLTEENLTLEVQTTLTSTGLSTEVPFGLRGPMGVLSAEQYRIFMYVLPVLYFTFALCGIATNIVNTYAFLKLGVTDSVSMVMFFLALSDLLLSSFQLVTGLGALAQALEVATGVPFFPIDPHILIFYFGGMAVTFFTMTTFTTTYLAVTRCMCVVQPLHFRSMFTVRRTCICLVLFVTFAVVNYIAACIGTGTAVKFNPKWNISRHAIWISEHRRLTQRVFDFISKLVIPITCQAIVCVSVALLIASLKSTSAFRNSLNVNVEVKKTDSRKLKKKRKGQGASSRIRADIAEDSTRVSEKPVTVRADTALSGKELRVARQVILISIVFMITGVPGIIRSAVKIAVPEFDTGKGYNYLHKIASHLIMLSTLVNGSTTLLIYLKFNTAFKNIFSRKTP